jgi:hypothetical protein
MDMAYHPNYWGDPNELDDDDDDVHEPSPWSLAIYIGACALIMLSVIAYCAGIVHLMDWSMLR